MKDSTDPIEALLREIRSYCVRDCCDGQAEQADFCPIDDCSLNAYRSGAGWAVVQESTLIAAIQARCLECADKLDEAALCSFKGCALWKHRPQAGSTKSAKVARGPNTPHSQDLFGT